MDGAGRGGRGRLARGGRGVEVRPARPLGKIKDIGLYYKNKGNLIEEFFEERD